jgi:uncharacterized membrane protein YoaK (UPF0700 family)
MTGNVVLLGFALAGAGGVSIAASLVALAAFLAGAVAGGRLGRQLGAQRLRLLTMAIVLEDVLVTLALLAAVAGEGHTTGPVRYELLSLLALAMGMQAATARRVGIPDLSTVVLTLTLTGLAAESPPAGGNGAQSGRRLAAVAAMLSGALIGGLLALHLGVTAPLGLAAGLLLLTAVAGFVLSSRVAPRAVAAS